MKTKVFVCEEAAEMAAALQSDDAVLNESDASDESTHDGDSGDDSDDSQVNDPCKYYNSGRCREGEQCRYRHVCKFALRGNCRHGSRCKLKHPGGGGDSSPMRSSSGASGRATTQEPKITDGRCYQWQLKDRTSWKDVDNDHIIEAQFCLPNSKSITIYNTPYGAVSIDLNRMRVCGKSLSVRRLDDGDTTWTWFCTLGHKWSEYGDKDSRCKAFPVTSCDIEQKFQSDPSSSFTFNVGAETLEIKFREMRQVSMNRKWKVARRPLYRQRQATARVFQAASALQNLSLGTEPRWQFRGSGATWHDFRRMGGDCSVTSDDIERLHQQNAQDSMSFTVKGDSYTLDLRAMTQTNIVTKRTRKIRRILV